MKRRRILLLLVLTVAVAAGLVLFWPRGPREPVYQGKPLSLWLGAAKEPPKRTGKLFVGRPTPPPGWTEASEAVRALGTNALPWLLYEFNSQVPTNGFRVAFNNWAARHPRLTFRFRIDTLRVTRAARGLQMLGPAVTPALPELARYFGDARRASDAVYAMAGAGELAIPWFIKALNSTSAEAEIAAVACLERLAPSTEAAIPPLVHALQHSNDVVRRMAAWALDAPTARPDLTVPALTGALSDSNAEVRRWSAQGLGWRAQHAAPGVVSAAAPYDGYESARRAGGEQRGVQDRIRHSAAARTMNGRRPRETHPCRARRLGNWRFFWAPWLSRREI